ncbi:Domain of uncharacterised function (DUF2825) [Arcanobacterium haemolyticum]|nr:Domain of uncharacterised function (DUF2825) [Arcanobacterium haemolyticum]
MCGEERVSDSYSVSEAEIPPRVRGRDLSSLHCAIRRGNTPACAGKSLFRLVSEKLAGKYPRVCGEEPSITRTFLLLREIPPRVRGRARLLVSSTYLLGNTPACAGKRRFGPYAPTINRKYPRVCGEEGYRLNRVLAGLEIPPRVRGRELIVRVSRQTDGNTPACAGKSGAAYPAARLTLKYPRVCGEEASYRLK